MKRIYRIGDEPMKERKGKGLFVFCCLAPAAILFILFMIVPTIEIFRISLYKWGGYTDNKTFVGLSNFKSLLQNQKFYQAFQNQILLIVLVTIITFAFALVFAYILSRENQRTGILQSNLLYPEYPFNRSYQCYLLCYLQTKYRTSEFHHRNLQAQ